MTQINDVAIQDLLMQTEKDKLITQGLVGHEDFFRAFWKQQAAWSQGTFGLDSVRGPMGAIKHLQKEAKEVENAPHDLEEYVDCFFLTLDASRRAGFTPDQFIAAVWVKLVKNQTRKWQKPTSDDAPIEHVRG